MHRRKLVIDLQTALARIAKKMAHGAVGHLIAGAILLEVAGVEHVRSPLPEGDAGVAGFDQKIDVVFDLLFAEVLQGEAGVHMIAIHEIERAIRHGGSSDHRFAGKHKAPLALALFQSTKQFAQGIAQAQEGARRVALAKTGSDDAAVGSRRDDIGLVAALDIDRRCQREIERAHLRGKGGCVARVN